MNESARPCDPGPLDDLVCQAKGIAAQADYNKDQQAELEQARQDFAGARSAYNIARHEAEKALATGRDQLNRIFANRCKIDKSDAKRLDRAWRRVKVRLEDCRPPTCCVDCECDWDDEIRNADEPDDIAALVARIQWHIDRAKRCFAELLDETRPTPAPPTTPSTPTTDTAVTAGTAGSVATASRVGAAATAEAVTTTATPPATSANGLAARVARVLAEIADIEKHAEQGDWPASKVYAAALVARWHLATVYKGFDDVNEYVDCLCRALTCLITGHAAVARLKRKQAVNKCHKDTWEKACAALDTHAVDEVLAEYLRICSGGYGGDDGDDGPDDDGYGDDGGGDDGGGDDGGHGHGGDHGGHGHGGHGGHGHEYDGGDDEPGPPYDEPPTPEPPTYDERPPRRSARPDERQEDDRGRGTPPRRPYRDARGRYRSP
ncbi:hypothetical protein [Pseudonocardia lacus]|uniref:hypothetical protein n=1 Tax=Pseudonocardia lacus TaxID=2835865 RepID=UPI001BDC3AC7|nr:hypothetical protein [Pseudonocardia lacus]